MEPEDDVKPRNLQQDKIKARMLESIRSRSRLIMAALSGTFIVVLLVSIAMQLIHQQTATIQTNRYLSHAQELRDDLNLRLDTVNDEYVTARLTKILSQADLYVYTNTFWSYSLTINGIPVSGSSVIIKKSSVAASVVLTETRRESPLPDAIINIGSATRGDRDDSIANHIKVAGAAATMDQTKEGLTSSYTFTISSMKPGEPFTIELSDQLGAKLCMPYTAIQVKSAD